MGFSEDQIDVTTKDTIDYGDKLQALINRMTGEEGESATKRKILEACEEIEPPIIRPVLDELEKNRQ